jgi:hypothetical protein
MKLLDLVVKFGKLKSIKRWKEVKTQMKVVRKKNQKNLTLKP